VVGLSEVVMIDVLMIAHVLLDRVLVDGSLDKGWVLVKVL